MRYPVYVKAVVLKKQEVFAVLSLCLDLSIGCQAAVHLQVSGNDTATAAVSTVLYMSTVLNLGIL